MVLVFWGWNHWVPVCLQKITISWVGGWTAKQKLGAEKGVCQGCFWVCLLDWSEYLSFGQEAPSFQTPPCSSPSLPSSGPLFPSAGVLPDGPHPGQPSGGGVGRPVLARLPEPGRVAQPCRLGPAGSVIRKQFCKGQHCSWAPGHQPLSGHWHC